jgi:hypothetical protein
MKKQILTLLSVTLLLSACSLNQTDQPDNSGTTSQNQTPTASQDTVQKSLKDLMGLGSAQKCTWNSFTDTSNSQGEMLINGQKFKQTVTIQDPEETITMNSISDGEFIYTWNDKTPSTGFKMSLSDTATKPSPDQISTAPESQNIDLDQKNNYTCSAATVSDTDFLPPTDIQFVDFSQEIPNYQEMIKQFAPTE